MARVAKLGRHNVKGQTYWSTRAGGKRVTFGNTKDVTKREANRLFLDHLQTLADAPADGRGASETRATSRAKMTVAELVDVYLAACQSAKLAANNISVKRSMLGQFANHIVGQWDDEKLAGFGQPLGDLPALRVTNQHLAQFLDAKGNEKSARTGKPVGSVTLRALQTHVKACWNWAANPQRGAKFVGHKPFAGVAKVKLRPRDLSEADLLTRQEYTDLLAAADADLGKIRDADTGKYRKRTPAEWRKGKANPYRGFADLLRVFYATGARPGELAGVRVRDFHRRGRQLTLAAHKRASTMANSTLRRIPLNDEAFAIVARLCEGKDADAPIFTNSAESAWNTDTLVHRFGDVREAAGVRAKTTLYDFRHLYISELLMGGVPMFKVAKMAGTSQREIERTYGHFFHDDLAAAMVQLDAVRAGGEN
jgi:integrase